MKKWICMMAVLALVACSTLTPEEKEARRVAIAKKVATALADRHYQIDVDMMYPLRAPGRNVGGTYSLEVRGDTLVSYLPYFGRSYQVPYGGRPKGLNFTEIIQRYTTAKDDRDQTIVTIEVTNEEDTYQYRLSILDNGNSSIDVQSNQHDPITFTGMMAVDE